ncbi:MAG: nucleotide sugar dehydrogenase [Candidatus Peribacteraceae bacterium]|nr:nucleotide sugar dehydrogenase [Candidatus Peribacteraceae bacterium]MDP7454630.1 nucleotide sugar dehydrogenase [Candidatus Peribacteraceae bacterium]MDP7645829.1 nucleotide sugar dehydrogenase [Candidatus Peribacteraceae bacterium]
MNKTIAIVGLGYVGLPLAHAFAKKGNRVIGYDISEERITNLNSGEDWTNELTREQLEGVSIEFSANPAILGNADVIIVALPTPIDENNKPDIAILKAGTETVGKNMKDGAIVVFESTVYPGTTEEICGGILKEASGGKSFKLGYSPERINPGDKEHTVTKILKIVAGEDDETTDTLCNLYKSIIEAGVHKASSIKVAEMAKAIENAQRDLNIAFVNEIAQMCNKLGIASKDVFDAAKTKWNFLPFQPGLVGGHCIGVDPYYLVEKAKQLGMDTHVITAGRSVNDQMGAYVASLVTDELGDPNGKRVLVLGITFKENVPDRRNSKSGDVIKALEAKGCDVEVHDPFFDDSEIEKLGFKPGKLMNGPYDAVMLLVTHSDYFNGYPQNLLGSLKEGGIFFDLKSLMDRKAVEREGYRYLAL